jgi:uncharacterized protein YqhQ
MEEINSPQHTVNLDLNNLNSLIGWATFRAVIDIIVGALSCLAIITAAYGVPQIIGGVRLLSACDELKSYLATNDTQKINEAFAKFNKFFKLTGISTIVKIVFGIIFFALYFVFIAIIFKTFMRNHDYFRNFTRGI